MPALQFGLDRLLSEPPLRQPLRGRRLALLAHPGVGLRRPHARPRRAGGAARPAADAAFGPQHGLRGDKQDNMVESADFLDPLHGIPVFSLYGTVRRPTPAMMATFDVLLIDLQDLGCRIYTFITTLRYLLEAAASMARRCGFSIDPIRSDGRSRAFCCAPAGKASSVPDRCRCATV
jgi:uncharacterized protein YbbC (DUF1343 family)